MKIDVDLSKFLITTALAAFVIGASACSENAREETREAADAVAADARAGAEKAADSTREAAEKLADRTKEAAGEVASATEDAARRTAQNTREIADKSAVKTREAAGSVADAARQGANDAAEAGSDGWITAKVRTKFIGESVLKGSQINVDTNNHVVTLKGTVASAPGKSRAEAIARGTDGVTRVVNELVVKASE